MTEVTKAKSSPVRGLVDDFKALSAKQWAGIVLALVVSLVLEIYFSTSCFGFFIVAVLLYMIPHLLGVSSVKVKTVIGVVFIVLALPILTVMFSGTLAAAQENLEGQENDYISGISYDDGTGEVTFTVRWPSTATAAPCRRYGSTPRTSPTANRPWVERSSRARTACTM